MKDAEIVGEIVLEIPGGRRPMRSPWCCACRRPGSATLSKPKKGRVVSADTALSLACYCGTSPELWLNLQSAYDLACEIDERSFREYSYKP